MEDPLGEEIVFLDQRYKEAYNAGQFDVAVEAAYQLCERAREFFGETASDYAACLNNLGAAYEALGDYRSAEELYWHAVEIDAPTDQLGYAQDLYNVAHLFEALGRYAEAEILYRKSLEIKEDFLGEEHPDVARNLNGLGHLHYLQGDYASAETRYEQAHKIWRDHPESTLRQLGIILNNLAMLYEDMGDNVAAERFYLQTLETDRQALPPDHPEHATSLNNVAHFYSKFGNYSEAAVSFNKAADIIRTALGEGHLDYAICLNNLGWLDFLQGDFIAAETRFQSAFRIRENHLDEYHPLVAQSLNNLGAVSRTKGDLIAAQNYYRKAIEIYRRTLGEWHPDVAVALNNLALSTTAAGDTTQALNLMRDVAAIVDRIIHEIFSIASERQRLGYVERIKWHVDSFISLLVDSHSPSESVVGAGLKLVLRRKGIVIDALTARRDALLSEEDQELVARFRELSTLRAQIAEKTFAGPGSQDLPLHLQLLAAWNEHKERLESEVARLMPGMDFSQRMSDANLQSIASVLPEGSALIEVIRFHRFDFQAAEAEEASRWQSAHYLAFVLLAERPDDLKLVDLGEADPIDQMILEFRASITGEDESRDFRFLRPAPTRAPAEVGTELSAALFEPLLPALDNCRRLFLAPDGDLNRLPFEVLPLGEGRRVIDDFSISYLGTGRDLLRLGTTSRGHHDVPIVIADPNFDLTGGEISQVDEVGDAVIRQSRDLEREALRFDRLPGTRMEGEQIAAMLGVEPWLDDLALEKRLKEHRSPRILHIATHGFFLADQERDPNEIRTSPMEANFGASERMGYLSNLENPLLRSGLALAGANTWLQGEVLPSEAEDAILNGEDVAGLDLLDTELVVLSACETGLGDVRSGEGVFGLQRAFILAGARTLVMSLWKVPDQQTQELMVDFYRRILAGTPRAVALREAQLEVKARHPDPQYWGAFILQGDPGPLSV
jgi:CHAT domain-containing protein/tetratricopeptide (TPR) repeat protein